MDQTKMRILSAAAKLFDIHGYKGTSVRHIAEEAQVNSALISYHFQGKQGVLETLIASYFDTLFRRIEEQETECKEIPLFERLEKVVALYVSFQCEHAPITRLIQRELSVESMLAREVLTLYISRWKHGLSRVIEQGMATGDFLPISSDRVVLAVISQMTYPFLQAQMVRQVYDLEPYSEEFALWLQASIMRYLRACLLPT
ncbi:MULTISPECIES: forespore capture DNA-binding protein RefZ [Brevibacillus]|uniref:Transcriptional regulator, TetR family n=1 Tax=Brevibacillus centrosporus TaxID=54910 RepID=A0A1I3W0C7_9BACL|nr:MULTISPECIES: forespore capture DNA-binding protein RefZ [Brevibacillus]MDR7314247.1 AcrR family transcriptional regulator [Brevibacillus nitrificans]MEC2130648.1 forespore capture DNA-binding protein RefZ [Brevibacillus centrosporus]MED1954528.1 forespore capture DNA-binding protein RefZ [Brevibacillus centrosporus]MED4908261.1 forespore capture DNA-binding protein RefZ [Brevibacillus centrosporus]RNB69310.1 TetR/AcrR family transcriptional regulator [Brevibacillus centrosporus]